jgi:predicted RNase H-like HicB family nuclease
LADLRPASFWARLLKLVDAELDAPHELVIVGGAAIGLRYASAHLTSDIDSVTSTKDRALWSAIERACKKLQQEDGLRRPVDLSFAIELEQEGDGRWIAEVPDLPGVLAYGATERAAIAAAEALALRVVADRLDQGEVDPLDSVGFSLPAA